MTIALDVGSQRMRTLRCGHERLTARSCRSAYAVVADTPARRQLLDQLQITYSVCDDALVILGDVAAEFAETFQTPCVPLLPGGRLPENDPPARQIVATLVESLIGKPEHTGEVCGLSVPGGDRAGAEFLTRIVRLQGYRPVLLHAGTAVVLAELVNDAFTGVGVSLGAGSCDVSVVRRATELAHVVLPRGGRWIDEQVARDAEVIAWDGTGRKFLNIEAVTRAREGRGDVPTRATPRLTERFAGYYDELATSLAHVVARELNDVREVRGLTERLPVVLCGRLALAPGLPALLERALQDVDLPFRLEEVRVASQPDYTVARGCLVHAELEAETVQYTQAAA